MTNNFALVLLAYSCKGSPNQSQEKIIRKLCSASKDKLIY